MAATEGDEEEECHRWSFCHRLLAAEVRGAPDSGREVLRVLPVQGQGVLWLLLGREKTSGSSCCRDTAGWSGGPGGAGGEARP